MIPSPNRGRPRSLARRGFASIIAVVVATVALAACDPTPDKDSFYTPPTPLPASQPGDVLRSRPGTFTLDPVGQTPVSGVESTQVLYRSTNATGQAIAVSGTVLVPTTPWIGIGSRPLVTFAVGTRGLGDQCAPSYTLSQGTDYEGLFIKGLLDRGWAVAVTDYEGLGTPGGHTYVIGQSEGRAVLDMARAAQRLEGTGLSTRTPVGIMGYSQGGGAAGWAAQLADSYAPELKVKGTAAGGVPADLVAVADGLEGNLVVAFALMASMGLDTAYPELNLESYLNDKGHTLLTEADDVCLVSVDGVSTLFKTAFTSRQDYVTTDPITQADWQARLAENELGGDEPSAPVYLYHGLVDTIIPYDQAADLREDWCDQGANVTWAPLPGEHVTGMVEGYPGATQFLANRFAGLPTFGTCWLP